MRPWRGGGPRWGAARSVWPLFTPGQRASYWVSWRQAGGDPDALPFDLQLEWDLHPRVLSEHGGLKLAEPPARLKDHASHPSDSTPRTPVLTHRLR